MPPQSPAGTCLPDRSLLRLSGEDVRGFLQGLVTQDVAGPLPVWAGLLSAQGKCLFDFIIWAEGDDLILDCEADAAEGLIKRLSIYRLRRPIQIKEDPTLGVHWSLDPAQGVPDPRLPELGRRWIGADGGAAADEVWREHRLRHGVCEGRAELGDLLWLECNAAELNGVSFSKGCFVGQENTARMNWRQKVNRRLVVVAGDGGDRTRIAYPELGLAVVHARAEALPDNTLVPPWLKAALA